MKNIAPFLCILLGCIIFGPSVSAEAQSDERDKITFRLIVPDGEKIFMDGAAVARSELVRNDSTSLDEVSLVLTSDACALFRQITSENTGKMIVIYFDGRVILKAMIREEIGNGTIRIIGLHGKTREKLLDLFRQPEKPRQHARGASGD